MQELDQIEAETIGGMLVRADNIALALDQGCSPVWFTNDKWSLLWSVLEDFWRRGAVDEIAQANLVEEARRLASSDGERRSADALTLTSITEAIDSAPVSIGDHLRLLRNDAIERRTKTAVREVFPLFGEYHSAADVVGMLRGRLDGVLDSTAGAKKIPARALLDGLLGEYREAFAQRVDPAGPRNLKWTPGLKMPWPKITYFMGGLRPGLHVVAARPSVGKTSYAINLMRFWCETGVGVMFCSLDMPRTEVMRRFLAERARVSARKAAFTPTATDLAAMTEAAAAIASWPLEIVETRDVDDLRTAVTIAVNAGRVKVLVVDYLQLLHARALRREDSVEYARVSYVSDSLKRIANDLCIPVIALAQLNRESTKADQKGRLPGLADLRGSGSIEQDAFTVTILHRDAATAKKWHEDGDELALRLVPGTLENQNYRYNLDDLDPIWWIMCKAQNGATGNFPFVVRKKYFAWMLSDYDAEPEKKTVGYGSTAHEEIDYSPLFRRVHSDWRHDPLEATLAAQLALIKDSDDIVDVED